MREKPAITSHQSPIPLSRKIGREENRKLRARRRASPGVGFGFRMFGVVGWSVAIPTLLGAAAGRWLDEKYPGNRSWTLALLVAGLCLGCLYAWRWVSREIKAIHTEMEEDDE